MSDDAQHVETEICWACDGEGNSESGAICRRCRGLGEVRADVDDDDDDDGLDCFGPTDDFEPEGWEP